MTKRIIISLSIIIMIALAMPYVLGILTQHKIKSLIANIPQHSDITVDIVHYRRGWLKSKVVYAIKPTKRIVKQLSHLGQLDLTAANDQSLSFTVKQSIQHGPILFYESPRGGSHIKFGRSVWYVAVSRSINRAEQASDMKLPWFVLQSLLHWDGSIDIKLRDSFGEMPFFLIGKQVKWSGLKGFWHLSHNLKHIYGHSTCQTLLIERDDSTITLSNTHISEEKNLGPGGLWFGETNIDIPFATVEIDGKEKVILRGFSAKTWKNYYHKVSKVGINLVADSLILDDINYGPVNMVFRARNIDTIALGELTALLGQFPTIDILAVRQLFPKLLMHGAQIHLFPVDFQTPAGKTELRAWLTFPHYKHMRGLKDQQHVLQQADGVVTLDIPKPIFEQALQLLHQGHYLQSSYGQILMAYFHQHFVYPAQPVEAHIQQDIQSLVDSNMITDEGDFYRIAVVLKDGAVFLNGDPFGQRANEL